MQLQSKFSSRETGGSRPSNSGGYHSVGATEPATEALSHSTSSSSSAEPGASSSSSWPSPGSTSDDGEGGMSSKSCGPICLQMYLSRSACLRAYHRPHAAQQTSHILSTRHSHTKMQRAPSHSHTEMQETLPARALQGRLLLKHTGKPLMSNATSSVTVLLSTSLHAPESIAGKASIGYLCKTGNMFRRMKALSH